MKTTAAVLAFVGLVVVIESATLSTLPTLKPGCMHNGKWYPEGPFQPDPCSPCQCQGGRAMCAVVDCFITPCVDFVRDPDQCCPSCPNGPNCRGPNGQVIPAGQKVQVDEDTVCSCPQRHGFMFHNAALCMTKAQPVTAIAVS